MYYLKTYFLLYVARSSLNSPLCLTSATTIISSHTMLSKAWWYGNEMNSFHSADPKTESTKRDLVIAEGCMAAARVATHFKALLSHIDHLFNALKRRNLLIALFLRISCLYWRNCKVVTPARSHKATKSSTAISPFQVTSLHLQSLKKS